MKIKIELDGLTLEQANGLTNFLTSLNTCEQVKQEVTEDTIDSEAVVKEEKPKATRKKAEKVDPSFYDLEDAQAPKTNLPKPEVINNIEVVESETVSAPTLMQIRSLVQTKVIDLTKEGDPKGLINRDKIKAKLTAVGAQNIPTLDAKHFQTIFDFLNEL